MASRQVLKEIQRARLGNPDAQLTLGKIYLTGGAGLPVNLKAAYRWLSAAADKGYNEASWLIGESIPGEMVDCPKRAYPYYTHAANQGSAAAMITVARWKLTGTIDQAGNKSEALSLLHAAAERGNTEAQFELGAMACRGETQSEHIHYLHDLANSGRRDAQLLLAEYYWHLGRGDLWHPNQTPGHPVETEVRSHSERHALHSALIWHERAWPSNNRRKTPPDQAYIRACLLLREEGSDALRWLEVAAGNGHAQAAYLLGLAFMGEKFINGLHSNPSSNAPSRLQSCRRNYKWAAKWLEASAASSLPEAFMALWILHGIRGANPGTGKPRGHFLLSAAELGHPHAAYELARMLWRGKKTGNDLEAATWALRAARRGIVAALNHLHQETDSARESLTDEENRTIDSIADHNPSLATRLEMALWFNLREHECLLLDVNAADAGDFLVIDVRAAYGKARRRIVRIDSARHRNLISRAHNLLQRDEMNLDDVTGDYASRRRLFRRLCKKSGVDPASLFQRQPSPARLDEQDESASRIMSYDVASKIDVINTTLSPERPDNACNCPESMNSPIGHVPRFF